jgi:hypothetical protein
MKAHWSLYELEYLHSNFETMTNAEISEVLGKSVPQITWQMIRQGWRRSSIKHWTVAELEWLRANAHQGMKAMAEAFNVPLTKIVAVLKNHKIHTGNNTQFRKGQNPWNAGRHERMSPKSEFKKGFLPANTLHDGAITIRTDSKTQRQYKYIRTAKAKWELLSRVTWVKHHGAIPKNMIVTFKDGDTLNCDISNLTLITMRENALRNVNRAKAKLSLADSWADGSRYKNDVWISKLLARDDKELQQQLVTNKELIETKRQQLLLRRQLKQQPTI